MISLCLPRVGRSFFKFVHCILMPVNLHFLLGTEDWEGKTGLRQILPNPSAMFLSLLFWHSFSRNHPNFRAPWKEALWSPQPGVSTRAHAWIFLLLGVRGSQSSSHQMAGWDWALPALAAGHLTCMGVSRMEPKSFEWCPETGQEATGTNLSRGISSWTWGRISSLWGWWSPGTGCPGRLWSLLLWRYSRPAWMRSCAACCRWPCFGWRVGLDDPQRSLPTPTILWFYDSACLLSRKMDVLCIFCLIKSHLNVLFAWHSVFFRSSPLKHIKENI